jgi:hypothetical protein
MTTSISIKVKAFNKGFRMCADKVWAVSTGRKRKPHLSGLLDKGRKAPVY